MESLLGKKLFKNEYYNGLSGPLFFCTFLVVVLASSVSCRPCEPHEKNYKIYEAAAARQSAYYAYESDVSSIRLCNMQIATPQLICYNRVFVRAARKDAAQRPLLSG